MSADPTDAELAGFNTLANVMTWAGMLGDPADNATAPGSLITGMGAVPTTHPRAVGGIPTPDFGILIDNWGIPQSSGPRPSSSDGHAASGPGSNRR